MLLSLRSRACTRIDAGDASGIKTGRCSGFWWTGTGRSSERCAGAFPGKEIDYTIEAAPASSGVVKISAQTEAEIKFGYCTEFIIVLNKTLTEAQEDEYRAFLQSMGDSIVLVADEEIVKTHVHTNDPGLVLQKALTFGS